MKRRKAAIVTTFTDAHQGRLVFCLPKYLSVSTGAVSCIEDIAADTKYLATILR